jgi:hypothetical protein
MQAACGSCTRETLSNAIKLLVNKLRVLMDIIKLHIWIYKVSYFFFNITYIHKIWLYEIPYSLMIKKKNPTKIDNWINYCTIYT